MPYTGAQGELRENAIDQEMGRTARNFCQDKSSKATPYDTALGKHLLASTWLEPIMACYEPH